MYIAKMSFTLLVNLGGPNDTNSSNIGKDDTCKLIICVYITCHDHC